MQMIRILTVTTCILGVEKSRIQICNQESMLINTCYMHICIAKNLQKNLHVVMHRPTIHANDPYSHRNNVYFWSRNKQNTDLESGIDADQHLLHAHLHHQKFAKNLHVVMHRPTIHANDPYSHRNNVYFESRNKQNTDLESGIDADQHLLHAHLHRKKFAKNLHVVMHRPTIHAYDPYSHRNNVYFGSRNKQNTDLELGIDADQHLLHAHLHRKKVAKNLHVVMHRPTIHANDPYSHRNNVYFGSRHKQNTDLKSGIDADQHLLHAHLQKWTIFATKFACYNAYPESCYKARTQNLLAEWPTF